MAVEKMYLINMVSKLENLEQFLLDIIDIGEIEPVDAFTGVSNRNFNVVASAENVDITEDISEIKSFRETDNERLSKLRVLEDHLGDETRGSNSLITDEEIDSLYDKLQDLLLRKEKLIEKEKELTLYKENINLLSSYGIDIDKLNDLNYFDYRYGKVSDDGRFILKNNYENIPSLIIHLDNEVDDISLEALDEIYTIDNKTTKLRADTDLILTNERENSKNVSLNLDKEFVLKQKDLTDKAYTDIMAGLDNNEYQIKEEYNKKIAAMDDLYINKKDAVVDDIVKSITEGGSSID